MDVYDGDTVKIVIYKFKKLMKFNCRMNGYDCAEMKPRKNKKDRDAEIASAKKAKNRMLELTTTNGNLLNNKKIVYVKCGKFDKYGRLLIDLYLSKKDLKKNIHSINSIMIEEGHGYIYGGGKKQNIKY